MIDASLEIAWEGEDGRRLRELRELFLVRSQGAQPAAIADYWRTPRDLALYDATLGARIGWRWAWVLDEAEHAGARRPHEPARTVVDLGCGSGVAARQAWGAGWIADGATVTCVDRSALATDFAARSLRRLAPDLDVRASPAPPVEPPELLLIGHLLLELDASGRASVVECARAARTTVWVEPGTHAAGRALSEVRDGLHGARAAVAPCPHAESCGLLRAGRERDWCHHFPEPPAEAFTEPLPAKVAHELGLDLRSLATSYLVLELALPARPADLSRVLGRPKVEKGRARVDLCTAEGVLRAELSKRDDPRLWRAWKRPGRERLLYRADLAGTRLRRAEPHAGDE